MPISLLHRLLATYSRSKHGILWQTNSAMDEILFQNNITLPENTKIVSWAPIKELLGNVVLLLLSKTFSSPQPSIYCLSWWNQHNE